MTLNEFYNQLARRTDTAKTSINVAETKRVLSEMFVLLESMDAASVHDIIAKGLVAAKKKSKK